MKGPEVAKHFRVSNETVSRWARAGLLHSVTTPSGRRLYPADQLDDFTAPDESVPEAERVAS